MEQQCWLCLLVQAADIHSYEQFSLLPAQSMAPAQSLLLPPVTLSDSEDLPRFGEGGHGSEKLATSLSLMEPKWHN